MNANTAESVEAMLMIHPYKEKLDAEMNEVLVISAEEFPQERGKAETKLGNLVADLSFKIGSSLYNDTENQTISFCLLNNGGLRTSLPKGEITRGKIFELMPFENELVVVTIDIDKMSEITKYLKNTGGQPISGDYGAKFNMDVKKLKDGNTTMRDSSWYGQNFNQHHRPKEIKILTTDYLANGGDKMNFFLNPIKIELVGIKLRDAIIQYCVSENKKGNQLVGKIDGRITFE